MPELTLYNRVQKIRKVRQETVPEVLLKYRHGSSDVTVLIHLETSVS